MFIVEGYNPWTKESERYPFSSYKEADSALQRLVIRGLENLNIIPVIG